MGNEGSRQTRSHSARTPRTSATLNGKTKTSFSTPRVERKTSENPRHNLAPTTDRPPSPYDLDAAGSNHDGTAESGITLADTLKITPYQCQSLATTWARFHTAPTALVQIFRDLGRVNANARELLQKASIMEGFQQYSNTALTLETAVGQSQIQEDGSIAPSCSPGPRKICDLREHGRLLAELIDFAVRHVDRPVEQTSERCRLAGAAHCPLGGRGLSVGVWDQLGDCLIEYVTSLDAVRRQRDAAKVWIPLVSFLVDQLRAGYQEENRRKVTIAK